MLTSQAPRRAVEPPQRLAPSIVCGITVTGLDGLLSGLFILVGLIFLYFGGSLFIRTKKNLEEKQRRKKEESRTLAPASPEWEKTRSESDKNWGKLAKEIAKKKIVKSSARFPEGLSDKKVALILFYQGIRRQGLGVTSGRELTSTLKLSAGKLSN